MKQDFDNAVLSVTNGYNGNVEVYQDFFKYSHGTQELILSDLILPMLYEYKSVHISIGYRNT